MGIPKKTKFLRDAEKISSNLSHRNTILFNMGKYHAAVAAGKQRYENIDEAKNRAANIKQHALKNLSKYLVEFESNHIKNGGNVLWASNSHEALTHIKQILTQHNVTTVVKSKSMTTEEIELNEELEKIGIASIETDLGEYIVQLAGEKPYHIVTPAMHKSKQDVADLFHDKFGVSKDLTAEELTAVAGKNLRKKYIEAGAGITGANFIVPDLGGIAVSENEGNAIMSTAFPNIHIAIVGIEKVIPSYKDLALFWPHLSQHGTGQAITVYNSIFTGPKKQDELHGPEHMYVILLDNGRTNLYENPSIGIALSCIRCGACLNACPIYTNVGGYTYNTTYQGPIGTVITPYLRYFDDFVHLNSACSLCGKCSTVCPVQIPLHSLILHNRQEAVRLKSVSFWERLFIKLFRIGASKHTRIDSVGGGIKNTFASLLGSKVWGAKRTFPQFAKKSFRSQYLQKNKKSSL